MENHWVNRSKLSAVTAYYVILLISFSSNITFCISTHILFFENLSKKTVFLDQNAPPPQSAFFFTHQEKEPSIELPSVPVSEPSEKVETKEKRMQQALADLAM